MQADVALPPSSVGATPLKRSTVVQASALPDDVMKMSQLITKATASFLERNCDALPLLQLQYGRNERWLVREFALAMNRVLATQWPPRVLPMYACCEYRSWDISVWTHDERAIGVIECKVLYSADSPRSYEQYAHKAANQLSRGPDSGGAVRTGMFFLIDSFKPSPRRRKSQSEFLSAAAGAVQLYFDIESGPGRTRRTPIPLSGRHQLTLGSETWSTSSWLIWGSHRAAQQGAAG